MGEQTRVLVIDVHGSQQMVAYALTHVNSMQLKGRGGRHSTTAHNLAPTFPCIMEDKLR